MSCGGAKSADGSWRVPVARRSFHAKSCGRLNYFVRHRHRGPFRDISKHYKQCETSKFVLADSLFKLLKPYHCYRRPMLSLRQPRCK